MSFLFFSLFIVVVVVGLLILFKTPVFLVVVGDLPCFKSCS